MNEPHHMKPAADVLPEPDEAAKVWSQALCMQIEEQCNRNKGVIPFSEFMQMALYAPGFGYYSGGLQKFGAEGDFITAPEVSPMFSQCLAIQAADVLAAMVQPTVLEFGAGSGVMAADILLELEQLECLPEQYLILELSADLKQRQKNTIKDKAAHLLDRVVWVDALPTEKFNGVVLANEVLDAMPIEGFRISGDEVLSLYVRCRNSELDSEYKPATEAVTHSVRTIEERIENRLPDGYCSEFNPAISGWLESISSVLEKGIVLLIDYGYAAAEYYHEERKMGTMMCHYQHRAHDNPLWYPGLQDITAFVDFTDVAYSAVDAGFDVSGYTSQAMFLMSSGLEELHQRQLTDEVKNQVMLSQQIKTLTMPSEMGERFKVMALTKNYDEPLRGFIMQDLRGRL
ncbi:MAG: SAM-dependent methyltransferase [Gammaproteobacteria bacterium]|nr:SAM-dependent methyltransferase [Gammaproteobacteria bacterium]